MTVPSFSVSEIADSRLRTVLNMVFRVKLVGSDAGPQNADGSYADSILLKLDETNEFLLQEDLGSVAAVDYNEVLYLTFSIGLYCTVFSLKVCNKVALYCILFFFILHTFLLYCTLFYLIAPFSTLLQTFLLFCTLF
jgi:hypothetical protein